MATKTDNFIRRTSEGELGQELSQGVPADGMQNASGDYPRREYNFGSSVNKAALGTKINELYTGGGDIGVPLNIPEQLPSQYPFNQVDETPSGHVIEMDDTPGGERVLIKHRKGSGVELRADGTVVISALNNKVEVTGGDQTVIIEGHGNLVYNGNLNLKVSGDYNVEVGGDYNVKVAGNNTQKTKLHNVIEVAGNTSEKFLGTKTERVVKTNTKFLLGDDHYVVKGNRTDAVQGTYDLSCGTDMLVTATESLNIVSLNTHIMGSKGLFIRGTEGQIGGQEIRYTGRTYSGARETSTANDSSQNPTGIQTAIFHGTFKGCADKAIHASKANSSVLALASSTALGAVGTSAAAAGFISAASAISGVLAINDLMANFGQEAESGMGASDYNTVESIDVDNIFTNNYELADSATNSNQKNKLLLSKFAYAKGEKHVAIDANDYMLTDIKGIDHYEEVFKTQPTTQEIRSAFRNESSRLKTTLGAKLIVEGKLNKNYLNMFSSSMTGRITSAVTNKEGRYGYTPIGNSLDNRGKRF